MQELAAAVEDVFLGFHQSKIKYKKPIVFLELGTTRLGPDRRVEHLSIREIVALKFHPDQQVEIFHTQIRKSPSTYPGFKPNIVDTFEEVANDLMVFLRNTIVIGFDLDFDMTVLETELKRNHHKVSELRIEKMLDIMIIYQQQGGLPSLKNCSLDQACQFYLKKDIDKTGLRAYGRALLQAQIFAQQVVKATSPTR